MITYTYNKSDISSTILEKAIINSGLLGFLNLEWDYDIPYVKVNFESELSESDKVILDTVVDSHVGGNGQFYQENYCIDYNAVGKKTAEEWYETDNGDGTYSGKAKRIEYTWTNNKLIQEDEFIYCTNGALWNKQSYKYYMNGNNVIKKPIL